MDVRMMLERLAPGMEHGENAEVGTEMARIGGEFAQRLGRGPKQDGVNARLVLEGDPGDRGRQGENDMEIGNGQEFGFSLAQPSLAGRPLTFGTVPIAAGVVGDADRAAIVTLFDMTAKRRRAARRDGAHDAAFATAQMAGVILAKSLAMVAKDIRQLDRLRHGPPQAGGMTSTSNPSSGLFVLPMVCVETCV